MTKKKPKLFTKEIDGEVITQRAFSPADEVQFVYDGWREVVQQDPPAAEDPDADAGAEPPAASSGRKSSKTDK